MHAAQSAAQKTPCSLCRYGNPVVDGAEWTVQITALLYSQNWPQASLVRCLLYDCNCTNADGTVTVKAVLKISHNAEEVGTAIVAHDQHAGL
jgi:hypothetical protein